MSSFDMYFNCINLSVLIVDDEHILSKILERMNLDEHELIDLPMKQSSDMSHKHTGVGIASILDTASTCTCITCGPAPLKGSSTKLLS